MSLSYNREPPCSMYTKATECSQFFHNVQMLNLTAGATYYYQIQVSWLHIPWRMSALTGTVLLSA